MKGTSEVWVNDILQAEMTYVYAEDVMFKNGAELLHLRAVLHYQLPARAPYTHKGPLSLKDLIMRVYLTTLHACALHALSHGVLIIRISRDAHDADPLPPSRTRSLPPSLTHYLDHLLPRSLIPSLPQSLSHSVTPSVTHSLTPTLIDSCTH